MQIKIVYKIYELYHGLLEVPDWANYKWFDTLDDALEFLRATKRIYEGYIILPTTVTYLEDES